MRSSSRHGTIFVLKKEFRISKLEFEHIYAWQRNLVSCVKFRDLLITRIDVSTIIRLLELLLLSGS